MRRDSDRAYGPRTGAGRRGRDRLLSEPAGAPALRERPDLTNLALFLDDDLREGALAVGSIEAFLLEAQRVLAKPDLEPGELRRLVEESRVAERLSLLEDALASLRRSMTLICATLK